jgi:hypothetical protein
MPGLDDVGDLVGQVLDDYREFQQIASSGEQAADALRADTAIGSRPAFRGPTRLDRTWPRFLHSAPAWSKGP